MRGPVVALLGGMLASLALATAASADALEDFLRRWEDPRAFATDMLHRDFRAELNGASYGIVLGREEAIAYNERISQILTSYTLRMLTILERGEAEDHLSVIYAVSYELSLRGRLVAVEEVNRITLARGGGHGFQVVGIVSEQRAGRRSGPSPP